jgi:hypothetical protein
MSSSREGLRKVVLENDLFNYMKGGEPEPVELATAPVLDLWETHVDTLNGRQIMRLSGMVSGHPVLGSGHMTSSPLRWLDRHWRWARTDTRVYRLEGRKIPVEGI